MHKHVFSAIVLGLTTALAAPAALADCVGVDPARIKSEAAKLASSPPAFASAGLPEITGLSIDAERTAQGAGCAKGAWSPTHLFYKTNASMLDVYKQLFPYIQPRENWISPVGGESHDITLTSGTEIELRCEMNCKGKDGFAPGVIQEIMVVKASGAFAKPLTQSGGPGWNWTPEDLAKGLYQPSAGRADSYAGNGRVAAPAPTPVATSSGAPAPVPAATPTANCPVQDPSAGANSAAVGSSVGAAIGGEVLGGGYGRNVGGTAGAVLGGVFGGGKKKQQPAATPNCP